MLAAVAEFLLYLSYVCMNIIDSWYSSSA